MKYVIDTSQIIQWTGRLTGVPRVEYELARRFLKEDNAVFVAWRGDGFYEVDARSIFQLRERDLQEADQSSPVSSSQSTTLTTLKKLVLRAPFASATIRYARSVRQRRAVKKNQKNDRKYQITAGDVLFIGQGLWYDKAYIEALVGYARTGVRVVQVVYDMLPLVAPQYSGHSTEWLREYATAVYPVADRLLAISHYTNLDIQHWLTEQGLHIPPIAEFVLGDDFKVVEPLKPQQRAIPENYILCVGTIEARKNHTLLYYVYKLARSRGVELPSLVIVGRRGWHTENIIDLMCTDPDVKDKVLILENASDSELSWLYQNCRFTVYPSFYEGWGLPVAESLHYKKPCVTSNTSSMPEVGGKAAIYFNPNSTDELLDIIVRLNDDKELAVAYEAAAHYRGTTWDATYAQIIKSIRG